MLPKKQYRNMLDDVCSDNCPKTKRCILKDFLVSSHPSPRILVQLKCVDKYRKVVSKAKKKKISKISWEEVLDSWIEDGCAKVFEKVYTEGVQYRTIYNKVIKGVYG